MPRSRQTASSSTYSLQVAQLQAADFPSGAHALGGGGDRLPKQPAQTQPSIDRMGGAIDVLDRSIPLPGSPRSFLFYLSVLSLIATGMLLHVLLAAQILQARVEVQQLKEVHGSIQNQNAELVWEIARKTNLEHIQQVAYASGYRPTNRRQYVVMPAAVNQSPAQAAAAPFAEMPKAPQRIDARPASAAATPMPEGRELAQWWQPWQERIEDAVTLLLERVFGS